VEQQRAGGGGREERKMDVQDARIGRKKERKTGLTEIGA
jgi:hypothetical protein